MVKSMHACLVLSSTFLAAGQTSQESQTRHQTPVGEHYLRNEHRPVHCAVNSILVMDELMNSIIFIWQGTLRCGEGKDATKCSIDVSNAIESVNGMINVILKAVADCGDFVNEGARCGAAVTEITGSMAGVAATSSGIAEHCPKTSIKPIPGLVEQAENPGNPPFGSALAHCIVDSKNLIKAVLQLSMRIADIADSHCSREASFDINCVARALNVLGAVGEMGEFIAGVVGHCSKPENQPAACAADVLGLIRNLNQLAYSGYMVSNECKLNEAQQLYLDNAKERVETPTNSNSNLSTFALAALLPMTAVLSFVAGRRMAKYRPVSAEEVE